MAVAEFRFTISDLATFLGKSPVTIRGWERNGMFKLPRVGKNRVLTTTQVKEIATTTFKHGRITEERAQIIWHLMELLHHLETR